MELNDIFFGLVWLFVGNLVFHFMYPIFTAILSAFSSVSIGEFELTSTITALGWGAYLFAWGFVGTTIPVYFLIKGAQK